MWVASLFVHFTTKSVILLTFTPYSVMYIIYNAIYGVLNIENSFLQAVLLKV